MSASFTAGIFTLEITDPYPMWCEVKIEGASRRFTHKDLRDLQHVTARAMAYARHTLDEPRFGNAGSEVE